MLLSVSIREGDQVNELNRWLQFEAPRQEERLQRELGASQLVARELSVGVTWVGADPAAPGGVGALKELSALPFGTWGGSKNPECTLWGGALNYAIPETVVAKVAEIGWRTPAAVQLLLMDQEENYFRLWMFRNGTLTQYAPAPPDDDTAW